MTQTAKQVFEEEDEGRAKEEIARFMQEVLLPGDWTLLVQEQRQNLSPKSWDSQKPCSV